MTNVLFIILPHIIKNIRDAKNPKARSYKAFPYGVLSIASYLKKNLNDKVKIRIIDCNIDNESEFNEEKINNCLIEFKPDIVGLSMNYDNAYNSLEKISKMIKEFNNRIIVVLGGSAASFSCEEIINEQNYIDSICYGEGELPFLNLVNVYINDEPKDNNLNVYLKNYLENDKSWVTKKSILERRKPDKTFVSNLDDVINIDYGLLGDNIDRYKMMEAFSPFIDTNKNKKQFFLVTSRGCPYKCIFCSTCSGLYNNKIRYASVDRIIDHVRYLVEKYHMNVLTIYDDQLLMNKERAKEIFRRLADSRNDRNNNLRIECPNGLSVAFIDDELAYLMKNAGMDTIVLAIEHGSEYMLRKVIHKPLNLKMVKPVLKSLRKNELFINVFFVIGIPGEKEEHREETMKFIRDMEFDWCSFNLATPLRGSQLYDICVKNGYIPGNLKIGDIEDKKYIIKTPDLDPDYINKKTYLMNLEVNFVNNYRMKIGDYEISAKCFQDVLQRTTNHAFAYYYLAKCQELLGYDPSIVEGNRDRFYEIVKKDNTWKEYAEHFIIDTIQGEK